MANATLIETPYETGYRRGLEWAYRAPETEVRDLLDRTRSPRWTEIAVTHEYPSLRLELVALGFGSAADSVIHLSRDPFLLGFLESTSFVGDAGSLDDDLDDLND